MSAGASGVRATCASNIETSVSAEVPASSPSSAAGSIGCAVAFQPETTRSRSVASSRSMSPTATAGSAVMVVSTRTSRSAMRRTVGSSNRSRR
ncbi:Uncharacterised protein [Mycobacteroides abscessus subsp. abscessus]|nr:Uncharacterised protein [Mycobacteroides abscessus subsp. abscessus]